MLQKVAARQVAIEVAAPSHAVVAELLLILLVAKVFEWIRPEQIAHWTKSGWFLKSDVISDGRETDKP